MGVKSQNGILKFYVISVLLYFSSLNVYGQNPYNISLDREASIIGLGAIGLGTSIWLNKRDREYKESDLVHLDMDQLWSLNAWSVHQSSPSSRKISDIMLRTSIMIPATLLADKRSRNHFGSAGLIALETLLINTALTNLSKVTARRKRPYLYRDDFKTYDWKSKNAHWSFYSGHTSTVASMSFVTAQMYSDFYAESSWKPLVWSTAAIIPAVTGYLRMKGGRHFFTDVLVGYIAGAAIGIIVPRLH